MMLSSSFTPTIIEGDTHATLRKACPLLLHANNCASATSTLYSLQDIRTDFVKVLRIHAGVTTALLSSSEMAMWLGLEEVDVITLANTFCAINNDNQDDHQKKKGNYSIDDDEDIMCQVYNIRQKKRQYGLMNSLRSHIEERMKWHSSGETLESVATPAAVNQSSLSWLTDIVAQEMELRREDVAWLMHGITARQVDIPTNHHRHLEDQVLATLTGITAPISLHKLFTKDNHTPSLTIIIPIVKQLCQQGRLAGYVSSSSLHNSIYTPNIFSHFQRNIIDSFFKTNGYITEKKCAGVGLNLSSSIRKKSMEEFVKESFPNAILLAHSVIDPVIICQPLEIAIQNALLNEGFADLRSLIPLDIVTNIDDVDHIVKCCLVESFKAQQQDDKSVYEAFSRGITLINSDIALFVSHEMCKKSIEILDPLVESYSKRRAKEIIENQSGASGAGSKKGKTSLFSTLGSTNDVVPLREVANYVGKSYPDLLQLQQAYEEDYGDGDNISITPSWNSEEVSSKKCDGPLIEFCRVAIQSEIERKCIRAVKAEVASLNSTLHGVSVSERSVGAAKQIDVQEAFEYSFKDLCHILQVLAKTIESFSAKKVFTCAEITSMKRELLTGVGSNLAKIITEYCLYKNNVDGARALAFDPASSVWPKGVDMMSLLDFPSVLLHCTPAAGGGTLKGPLHYLRKLLPGSSGLSLALMWKLCEVRDDESQADEKLDQFCSHLAETCLTLVGIPFSILDKKTEKKMMAMRRQGLIDRIEKSNAQDEILSTCVALIYQQTKSMMISGSLMISLVLNKLFEEEKKIPKRATEVLFKLNQENGVSPELLILAKQFGIAKNNKALAAISDNSL